MLGIRLSGRKRGKSRRRQMARAVQESRERNEALPRNFCYQGRFDYSFSWNSQAEQEMYTPPGTPRSRSLTRFTIRVGLPHFGQSVLFEVSITFWRSAVLAILAMKLSLNVGSLSRAEAKSFAMHARRERFCACVSFEVCPYRFAYRTPLSANARQMEGTTQKDLELASQFYMKWRTSQQGHARAARHYRRIDLKRSAGVL